MVNTRQPNLTVQGKAGWCLSFTQDVWGTPHIYPKAIDAWNASGADNHPNEQPPSDVSVVCYWTYTEGGVQYGHIATSVPGKGVYSSPFNSLYGSQWFASVGAVTNRINQIAGANSRYLGWSESLSGVKLVIQGVDMIPDQDNFYWRYGQDLAMRLRGRQLSRAEFRQFLVGKTGLQAVEILSDDPEATKAQNWQDIGRIAVTDNWQNQIYTLQAQLADAKKNVEAVLADSTASKAQLRDALARVVELENTPIIKEVPVYTHDEETKRMVSSMYNYFVGQFKSFAKYIKK